MATSSGTEAALDRIARSVDLLVRLKAQEVRGEKNQKDMILLLGSVGATAAEVASILGLGANVVAPVLSRAKASSKPSKPVRKAASKRPNRSRRS